MEMEMEIEMEVEIEIKVETEIEIAIEMTRASNETRGDETKYTRTTPAMRDQSLKVR